MRKPRFSPTTMRSVNIHRFQVWAYPLKERYPGQVNGMLRINYSEDSTWGNHHDADFPLISVWLDPNRTDAIRCCKVYATIPRNFKTQNQENACKVADYLRSLSGERKQEVYGSPRMKLTVDDHEEVIRYGATEYPYRSSKPGTYETVPVFDSKAEALNSILDAIKNYASASVAGIDLINLDSVSDQVLIEMGFAKIPDQMEQGVPMWSGDAQAITSLGRRRYGASGGNTGEASSSEIVESFLDLLEMDLNTETVKV